MSIAPILFYDLLAVVLILGIALAILAIYYAKILKRVNVLAMEKDQLSATVHKKAQDLLESSQEKSAEIIEKAQSKALELINSAQFYNEETRHIFQQELEKAKQNQHLEFSQASSEFLKSYEKALEEIKSENIKGLHKVSEDIQAVSSSQVGNFEKIIEEETLAAQKIVEEKIEKEYQVLKSELDNYKKTEIQKVERNIVRIIRRVSEKVLSKGLSMAEHEQIVLQSLEEAKKELV